MAIVGPGTVGTAVAHASTIDRLADEIALFDVEDTERERLRANAAAIRAAIDTV